MALTLEVGDSTVDRLDLQDHPRLTPEGIVIDTPPLIRSVVTDIVDMKLEEALLLGTADDGVLERALEELGHDGEDIYSHVGIYLFDRVRRREGGLVLRRGISEVGVADIRRVGGLRLSDTLLDGDLHLRGEALGIGLGVLHLVVVAVDELEQGELVLLVGIILSLRTGPWVSRSSRMMSPVSP